MGGDSALPIHGVQLQFLVGELRSHMPKKSKRKKRSNTCAASMLEKVWCRWGNRSCLLWAKSRRGEISSWRRCSTLWKPLHMMLQILGPSLQATGSQEALRKTIPFSHHQVSLKASAADCSFFLRTPVPFSIDLTWSPSQSQRNKLPWEINYIFCPDMNRRKPSVNN